MFDVASSGVTVRGIDLEAFDDWMNHIRLHEPNGVQATTVFFPLHRVEKIMLDEGIGTVPSLSDMFVATVGRTIEPFLE